MKKTKILTVVGTLLAMSLTACGGSSGGSQGGGSSHKHVYENWTQTQAPTCTEKGQEEGTCACGEKSTRPVNALGHDWGEWEVKTAATCTTDGEEERACKRAGCTAKETQPIKAEHAYGDPQTIAASGEGVEYTKEVCSKDGVIRLKVNQSKVTYDKGERKSGTPEGYTKLKTDGDIMSFKFNYDHFAIGKLYFFGRMDGFSTDANRASGVYDNGSPNVEVKINGDVVDMSAQKNTTYVDVFGEESIATDMESPSNYLSNEGYFPVGDIVLQDGVNQLIYKRVKTRNMIIKDFVFVVENSEHTHVAATTYSSDETGHWHACTALGCPTGKADAVEAHTLVEDPAQGVAATCSAEGKKVEVCSVCGYKVETKLDKLAHTFGEPYDIVAATCEAAGSQKKKCTVCQEEVTEVLPKLDHQFGDAVENYAAGEGYIATTAHNCSTCNKSALRWSALDYDQTESSSALDRKEANGYVRFGSGTVENNGTATEAPAEQSAGSHIFYYVNVPEAVEKAGLAFKINNTSGNSGVTNVFDPIPNDTAHGYVYKDGQFTHAQKRYGLRVNDVEYYLGEDKYGNQSSGWFEWPVEFPLKAGINKIDVFPYLGYRAQMLEFELIGLPHVTPSHVHNGANAWVTDADNHWHLCTETGCPIADGIYDKAAHTWGQPYDVVEATCTAKGSYKVKCSVCDYVKTVETDKVAHAFGDAQAKVGDATPYECGTCHAVAYQLDVPTPQKLKSDVTWSITGLPAGNYDIELYACAASTTLTQKYDARYQFKVDGGDYVSASDDNATYASYGLGTGEKLDNCKWSSPINQIAVGDTAASFTIHWTNKGYSAFIAAVRLVKAAA